MLYKHLFLSLILSQTTHYYGNAEVPCFEDPSSIFAGRVASGSDNTAFATCGLLASNPSFIPLVCGLDPQSIAEPLAPASLCQETCNIPNGDLESPSSEFLVLLQTSNGAPNLYDAFTCGDLAQASENIITAACNYDLSVWDDYQAFTVCCETCSTLPPTPSPTMFSDQCLSWSLLGQDIDGDAANDEMGSSVAISANGKRLAAGASRYDGDGLSDTGLVRIYDYVEEEMQWIQTGQDLIGLVGVDHFGNSVAISADGSTVVVGARFADPDGTISGGQVRVFVQVELWEQTGIFNGDISFANLGESVDISSDGNIVAMSAPGGGNYAGQVQVYSYSDSNQQWTQVGSSIIGETSSDESGTSISLSSDGNTIAIGSKRNSAVGFRSGHVRVFKFDGSAWNKIGNDIDGEASGDESGSSVDLSADGTIVAIGAPENGDNGYRAGHARVYKYDTSGWTKMGQDIDGENQNDFCGSSVALSSLGNIVAVGAKINDSPSGINSGHVRVYKYDDVSNIWTQTGDDIDGEFAADWLGSSVAMSADGRIIAAGASFNDANGSSSGHVRVVDC